MASRMRSLGEATHDVSDRDYTPLTRDLMVTMAPVRARYVRVDRRALRPAAGVAPWEGRGVLVLRR